MNKKEFNQNLKKRAILAFIVMCLLGFALTFLLKIYMLEEEMPRAAITSLIGSVVVAVVVTVQVVRMRQREMQE